MIWLLWVALGIVGLVVLGMGGLLTAALVDEWRVNRQVAKANGPDSLTTRKLLVEAEKDWKKEYEALVIEVEECIGCLNRARRAREEWRRKRESLSYYWPEPAALREMGNAAKPTKDCPRHQHTVAEWW